MAIVSYVFGIMKALLPFLRSKWLYARAAGVRITEPADHGQVPGTRIWVKGRYRFLFNRTLMLFHVVDHNYYPQGPAVIDSTRKRWEKDVTIGLESDKEHTVVVAAITPDFMIATNYYGRVHELLLERQPTIDTWLPLQMFPHQEPPGYIELDRISIRHH